MSNLTAYVNGLLYGTTFYYNPERNFLHTIAGYDTGNGEVALTYDANDERKCWNLVGNPFSSEATLDREYYVLSADGLGINPVAVSATTPIPPFTAVFVKAVTAGDRAVFTKVTQ